MTQVKYSSNDQTVEYTLTGYKSGFIEEIVGGEEAGLIEFVG